MSAKEKEATEVKKETTEQAKPAPKAVPKAQPKASLTYLGPTIPGVIRHATVFFNGILPDKAQKCVSEFPIMRRLFVTADEMVAAVTELRKESALSAIYEQVEQKYQRR